MIEAPGGDVDLTGTIAYLVSERRAADVTKVLTAPVSVRYRFNLPFSISKLDCGTVIQATACAPAARRQFAQ